MSSNQRWTVGEDTNDEQNESDVDIKKALLQNNEIPENTPFIRMVSKFGFSILNKYH